MDAWSHFITKSQYGVLINRFFLKLSSEIAQVTADPNKKDGILIVNTKKGYWMYKVFADKETNAGKGFDVRSDRYVKQLADYSALQDKLIYLVDDTLNYGNALFGMYELLSKRVDAVNICPIVFAISDRVDIEQMKAESSGVELEFWSKLKYFVRMSEGDMGLFCVQETKLLNQVGVPYVIGMPYLKEENAPEMNFQVNFSREQFEKLRQGSENWIFHSNERWLRDEQLLQGFIIQMQDKQLLSGSQAEVMDWVIAGTYVEEDEKIKAVLVPFAVVGSLDKSYLLKLYRALFEDIDTMFSAEAEWIGCYQECVYALSLIVSERFAGYLEQEMGICLSYDYSILLDHFNESFINKAELLSHNMKNDLASVSDKIIKISDRRLERLNQDNTIRKSYTEKVAYDIVLNAVLKKRNAFLINRRLDSRKCTERDSVVEITKIRKLLDDEFSYSTENEMRYAFSQPVVTNLQTSICGTRLYISRDGEKIEKGLRYGEISDLVLPFFDLGFYWAVLLLAEKKKETGVMQAYDRFAFGLRKKYENWGIIGKDITEDEFDDNEKYYKEVLENNLQLYNKYFLLQPYLQGRLSEDQNRVMRGIEDFVQNL